MAPPSRDARPRRARGALETARRRLRRVVAAAGGGRVVDLDLREHVGQILELTLGETIDEMRANTAHVRGRGFFEPSEPGVGENRVRPAPISRAAMPLDEPVAHQSVDAARDTAR